MILNNECYYTLMLLLINKDSIYNGINNIIREDCYELWAVKISAFIVKKNKDHFTI